MSAKDPWFHAEKADRNYITPEDVTAAIKAGAKKLSIFGAVLDAIERSAAEDYRLCAFIALTDTKGRK